MKNGDCFFLSFSGFHALNLGRTKTDAKHVRRGSQQTERMTSLTTSLSGKRRGWRFDMWLTIGSRDAEVSFIVGDDDLVTPHLMNAGVNYRQLIV